MKLNWKLTLSYTLVTVAALMVIEGLVLGGFLLITTDATKTSRMMTVAAMESAAQMAPYFDGPQVDVSGIAGWLGYAAASGFSTHQGPTEFSFTMGRFSGGDNWMAVFDANKRLLAVFPRDARQKANEVFRGGSPIEGGKAFGGSLQSLATLALAGETNPEHLFFLTPDKRLVIAVPIQGRENGRDNHVVGTLVVSALLPQLSGFSKELLGLLIGSLIMFTVGAGALGTAFGHFSARGLVRRLSQFMKASDAWSSGNLTARISDASKDEIGVLASRLNVMAEELQEMVETRKNLAVTEERHRLERELHDSVKQRAFAAAMQIGCASQMLGKDQAAAARHLENAEQLVHQIQTELLGLLSALRPVYLQGRTLAQALEALAADWASHKEVAMKTEIEEVGKLPSTVEQALLRVAEEALSNAERHSQARQVTVNLGKENGAVVLSIADNGKGFDQSGVRIGATGIINMRERMAEIGGSVKVESQEGNGTSVTAAWPVAWKTSSEKKE